MNLMKIVHISLLGRKSLLEQTLTNHIWDVLKENKNKQTQEGTSSICVEIGTQNDTIEINIHNAFMTEHEARIAVSGGNTLIMLRNYWERFGGKLEMPTSSTKEHFRSMMCVRLPKSLRMEENHA